MAALHARTFANQGRVWSADEFSTLLDSANVFCVGDSHAFALGRVVADEAELLTIATDPDHQRKGLGRSVLAAFEHTACQKGAQVVFLEVAQSNDAAVSLYQSAGYAEISRRKGYYKLPVGKAVDALILQKHLG